MKSFLIVLLALVLVIPTFAQNRDRVLISAQTLLPSTTYYFPACSSGDSTGTQTTDGWILNSQGQTTKQIDLFWRADSVTGSAPACSIAVTAIYAPTTSSKYHYLGRSDSTVVINGKYQTWYGPGGASDTNYVMTVPYFPHAKRRYMVTVKDTTSVTMTERETLVSYPSP